jgi:type II secretory pathway component PulF
MPSATLDDLMAMNEQLAALTEAGVPLDAGLGNRETQHALGRINAVVARQVSRGAPLDKALEGNEEILPSAYRRLVQMGISTGNLSATLDRSRQLADSADQASKAARMAFVYPLILFLFAYVGMIGFCWLLVPVLESMAESMRVPPGPGLRMMQTISDTLELWVWIPPIAIGLWVLHRLLVWLGQASRGRTPRSLTWIPGVSRAIFDGRCANFARMSVTLLEEGVPLSESLSIAAGACGDDGLQEGVQALAIGLEQGRLPPDNAPAALRFPPFLRWALWHSEGTVGRERALRMAVGIYEHLAQRRADRLRIALPIVTCALVGGGITLLYCLALFVPVVEMLRAVASSTN